MSRVLVPALFVVTGIAVMAVGVFDVIPGQVGVIALAFGFLIVVAGLVIGMRDRMSRTPSQTKGTSDVGGRLRLVFAGAAMVTIALPYLRIPLASHGAMATGVDVPRALLAGNAPLGVLVGAAFLAVLVAGVFLSAFHHVGGYVLLLDVIALTVLVGRIADVGVVTAVTEVFGPGLYLVALAGVGVVATQFVVPETDDGSTREFVSD